jgi:chemotaxis protein MotA
MSKFASLSPESYARAPVMAAGAGFLIVLASLILSTHSFLAFFSIEGLVIVGGGVIAVAFMSFPVEDVHEALRAIGDMFKKPQMDNKILQRDMMKVVGWAYVVREKGMRSFESLLDKSGIDDPFVKYGLNMVVSQYTPDEVRTMMETAADARYERDIVPVDVLQAMTSHAPAFGMVGTLVGMVAMLCNLNDNIASIGASLGVSFLSTLYGVLSARMIYMPAAARLRQEVDSRRFRNHLITEGMVMLVGGKNPMHIQDHLNSFLRPEIYNYMDYLNKSIKRSEEALVQAATGSHFKKVSA